MHSVSSQRESPLSEASNGGIGQSEKSGVLAILDQMLASSDIESILQAATRVALAMTESDGVAVALKKDDAVVCRARCGSMAPAVGSTLDPNSGISGECLRVGTVLRCDDSESDPRVDAEACRRLGVRSLVAVPVKGKYRADGLVEAFSARTHAFGSEDIQLLERIAEIVAAAFVGQPGESKPAIPSVQARKDEPVAAPTTLSLSDDQRAVLALANEQPEKSGSSRKWLIGGVIVLIAIAAGIFWFRRGKDVNLAAASKPETQTSVQTVAQVSPIPKPDATVGAVRAGDSMLSHEPAAKQIVHNAAELGSIEDAGSARTADVLKLPPSTRSTRPTTVGSESAAAPPPSVAVVAANTDPLRGLVSATPSLPELSMRISEGVVAPTLIHRVLPAYPAAARSHGVEGAVILEMTVAADGSTTDIHVISGPPLMTQAAIEAVRQWRYHPALLNGKPTPIHEQVTLRFELPE